MTFYDSEKTVKLTYKERALIKQGLSILFKRYMELAQSPVATDEKDSEDEILSGYITKENEKVISRLEDIKALIKKIEHKPTERRL